MGTRYDLSSCFTVRTGISREQLEKALAPIRVTIAGMDSPLSVDSARGATTVSIEVHEHTSNLTAGEIDEDWIELVKCCADFSDGPVEATSGGDDYEDGPIEWLIGPKIAVLRQRLGETYVRIADLQDRVRRLRRKLTGATAARKRRRRDVVIAEYP